MEYSIKLEDINKIPHLLAVDTFHHVEIRNARKLIGILHFHSKQFSIFYFFLVSDRVETLSALGHEG